MTLTINKKTYEAGELVAYVEKLEKENKLLGEHCLQLLKDKGKLTDKCKELDAQIEKMKCCGNCEHFDFTEPNYCHKGVYREHQYVCAKWKFVN